MVCAHWSWVDRAGTWIEIDLHSIDCNPEQGRTRAGTWIEIGLTYQWASCWSYPVRVRGLKSVEPIIREPRVRSYPVRVRGLKFEKRHPHDPRRDVVPRAGTWIEIQAAGESCGSPVVPRAVRGLKFHTYRGKNDRAESYPVRVRGLKSLGDVNDVSAPGRTPCGTWIEISALREI